MLTLWWCPVRRDRSRARSEKRIAIFREGWRGPLWQERSHSYPMDERKGLGSLVKSSSRSLFSPSTIFGQIRLTRRSVQSQADSGLLTQLIPVAFCRVDRTFLYLHPRDT